MHQAVRKGVVTQKARRLVEDTWQSEAILSLFLAVLVTIVFIVPLTNFVTQHVHLYIEASFSLMLIFGMALTRRQGKLFYFVLALGLVTLAVRWIYFWHPHFVAAREILTMTFILLLTGSLLAQVLAKGHVTAMRIQGAVAVYLMAGIGWAHAYHIVHAFNPDAFALQTNSPSNAVEWIYYSFTTLTTLGYGDILPLSRVARMLCVGEALSGQLYLAVMLARLVALQVSDELTSSKS